jgi:hypothetical protein
LYGKKEKKSPKQYEEKKRYHMNEEFTPLLPTGIGERF